MSFRHVRKALGLQGVNATEKLVLIALAERANNNNQCWPGQNLIAQETCVYPTTVSKVIRSLRDKGLVSCRRKSSGGQIYTLHLPDCNGANLQSDLPDEQVDEENGGNPTCSESNHNLPDKQVELAPQATQLAPKASPYKGSIEPSKNHKGTTNGTFCAVPAQGPPKTQPYGGEEVANVNDVLQQFKCAQSTKYIPAQTLSPKIADLERLWVRVHAEIFPEKFTPELTGKERGQLGQYLKKATPKYAELALYSVIREWIEFKEYAVNYHGALNCKGVYPVLGYVVKHAGIAVNYVLTNLVPDWKIDEKGLAYVGQKFVEFYDGKDHKKLGKN